MYEFEGPGCSANYVEKNDRALFKRNVEQAGVTKTVLLTSILLNAVASSIGLILSNETYHYFFIVLLMAHMTQGGPK